MKSAELLYGARYGRLAFDLFVLDHWESTTCTPVLPVDHQQRWNELARRYLRLSLLERWPFYKRIRDTWKEDPLSWPTEEQINRILAPHQTIQERNICAPEWNSVWLRTCYNPSLAEKYLAIERAAHAIRDFVLDDASLYSFEGSDQEVLDQLLLRIPGLTDAQGVLDEYKDGSVITYASGKNDPDSLRIVEALEGQLKEVSKVGLLVQNMVFVVDEDAVQRNVVKVWWFDEFGKILWDNYMRPESKLRWVIGPVLGEHTLEDMVGDTKRGDLIT